MIYCDECQRYIKQANEIKVLVDSGKLEIPYIS